MEVGTSEAEPIWTEFLRKLTRRGLRGVKLVVSDAHEGIKAAVSKVLNATWQRCRVHFMRNVLAHAGKSGRRVVSAFIATAFAQETPEAASTQWRAVADQIRPKVPKLAAILDVAEPDVLAYMTSPKEHRAKLHSTDDIDKRFFSSCAIFSWHGRPRGEERSMRMKAPPRSLHHRSSLVASVRRFGPCGFQRRTRCSYALSAYSDPSRSRSRSSLRL